MTTALLQKLVVAKGGVLAGAMGLLLAIAGPVAAADDATQVDNSADVGEHASMVLDGAGNPVISYHDETNGTLRLLRCNDPLCAGGDDLPSTLDEDAGQDLGEHTSLVLDAAGNPVIAYHSTQLGGSLKVLHCDDPDCDAGDAPVTVASNGDPGVAASLAINAAGTPVIAYLNDSTDALELLTCTDQDCAGASSRNVVDDSVTVGPHVALALDAAGDPTIAYFNDTADDLMVVHCDDPLCADGNETPVAADTDGAAGQNIDMVLDDESQPVLTYEQTSGLRLRHCNDAECDPTVGGADPFNVVDADADTGPWSALALDPLGNPVVLYSADGLLDNVRLVHCDDPVCAGGDDVGRNLANGTLLIAGFSHLTLALNSVGHPIGTFYDPGTTSLNLVTCDDPACAPGDIITTPVTAGDSGLFTSVAFADERPVVTSLPSDGQAGLDVVICSEPTCETRTLRSLSGAGIVPDLAPTSLALTSGDLPVIALRNQAELGVIACDSTTCDGGQLVETFAVDGDGVSLLLGDRELPVASFYHDGSLAVLVCDDTACGNDGGGAGGDTVTTVTAGGAPSDRTSVALNPSGDVVVSFHDATAGSLRLLTCDGTDCDLRGAPTAVTLDAATSADVGGVSSLALNGALPVIAYVDEVNDQVRLLRCTTTTCSSPSNVKVADNAGPHVALALDTDANPTIAYHDNVANTLGYIRCDDPACTGGGEHLSTPDPNLSGNAIGEHVSLALDRNGFAAISYYDATSGSLKLLRCDDRLCIEELPPTANAGGPYLVDTGDPLTLTASGTDPNGTEVVYQWDLDADVVFDDATDESQPDVVFDTSTPGEYPVALRVVDGSGSGTINETTVLVNDPPFLTIGGGPFVIGPTESVEIDAGTFGDPDGGLVTFEWDLDGDLAFDDDVDGSSSVIFDANGRELGEHVVRARVTDDEGGTAEDQVTVKIAVPPTADAGGPYTVAPGATVDVIGTGADPDGGNVTFEWDFDNDGGTDATTATATFDSGGRPNGAQLVNLRVTDDEGVTTSDQTTVTIEDPPPAVGGGGGFPVPEAPSADLYVEILGGADSLQPGEATRVDVKVVSQGPDAAEDTLVEIGVQGPVSVVAPTGCTRVDRSTIECEAGNLVTDDEVVYPLDLPTNDAGTITVTADVRSNLTDPDTENNSARRTIAVEAPLAPAGDVESATPIEAAVEVSQRRFADAVGGFAQTGGSGSTPGANAERRADHVVLSRVDVFADSLTGSALTGQGPLLLTPADELDAMVGAEIKRVLAEDGRVYLLGGEAALSADVENGLRADGYDVVRLSGPSRIETALSIADEVVALYGEPARVAIARSRGPEGNETAGWADSISAGGLAAATASPILLTPTDLAHPSVVDWLAAHPGPERLVLGGAAAVTDDVVAALGGSARVQGPNRFATAVAIVDLWEGPADGRIISSGEAANGWAYGLVAAGLGADTSQPLLLVASDRLPDETAAATCGPDGRVETLVIGGLDVVSQTIREALAAPCHMS